MATLAALALLSWGCADASESEEASMDSEEAEEVIDELREGTDVTAVPPTTLLGSAVSQSCETSILRGLSEELVAELNLLAPNTLSRIDDETAIHLGPSAFAYLQTPVAAALKKAAITRKGITVNSALRTLPQQYMLYRFYQVKVAKRLTSYCGVKLAKAPGSSPHESGIGIDLAGAGFRIPSFKYLGRIDPMHYTFTGNEMKDIGGLSVLAFQRLWNRAHPEDQIPEDSTFSKAVETRLDRSPIGGFAASAPREGR
jgi:hypothetical protein